jgi:hypothetical protein
MKIIEYNKINLIVLEILLSLFMIFPFKKFYKIIFISRLVNMAYVS